jgi:LacI family transcriptional regulator
MVLVDCGEDRRQLADLFLLELTQGLQQALLDRGYGPVVNATRGVLRRMVAAHAVDGVILAAGVERAALAREIAGKGTPCVVIEQVPLEPAPLVGCVLLDLQPGAREAARLLLGHGHRRIGFIGNFEEDVVRDAFTEELAALGAPLEPAQTLFAGRGRDAGAAAMRRLLEAPQPPTAVFARTDLMASGALQTARELGYRVPADLSLVGHDDIPLAATLDLTTVRIDYAELGRAAAEALSRLRQEGTTPEPAPLVPTRLVARSTVGPPRRGA